MKKIIYWVVGIVIVGLVVWGLIAANSTPIASQTITMPKVGASDITNGTQNPKVTLVEYADFQCPGCGAYYPIVKQLQTDFKGQMLYVYRFFPLSQIHKNAINSAAAGYAANKQEKFFEMMDLLFPNQTKWAELDDPSDTFYGYAKDIGLNVDKFKKDYLDQGTRDFVQKSADTASTIGLPGTPSFFVNGKYIASNPQSYQDFKKLIQENMAK